MKSFEITNDFYEEENINKIYIYISLTNSITF